MLVIVCFEEMISQELVRGQMATVVRGIHTDKYQGWDTFIPRTPWSIAAMFEGGEIMYVCVPKIFILARLKDKVFFIVYHNISSI